MKNCNSKDCANEGLWRFEVSLWAIGFSKKHTAPAVMAVDLIMCNEHRLSFTLKDFLNDQGRVQIEGFFLKAGKAKPDWSRAEITFTKV